MNKTFVKPQFIQSFPPKIGKLVFASLLIFPLIMGLLIAHPAPVEAGAFSAAGQEVAPTPVPTRSTGIVDPAVRTSPVIGILILLAPLVFLVWKSRGLKEPKVRASCCAPVIDESKRPFRIEDDAPAP